MLRRKEFLNMSCKLVWIRCKRERGGNNCIGWMVVIFIYSKLSSNGECAVMVEVIGVVMIGRGVSRFGRSEGVYDSRRSWGMAPHWKSERIEMTSCVYVWWGWFSGKSNFQNGREEEEVTWGGTPLLVA
jgi:hypothetical protein